MARGEAFIFFGKYTTLIGDDAGYPYPSEPWEVVPYNELTVEVFAVAMTGPASFSAELQESNDLEQWALLDSASLTAPGTFGFLTAVNTARFVRLVITDFMGGETTTEYYCLWAKGVARNG